MHTFPRLGLALCWVLAAESAVSAGVKASAAPPFKESIQSDVAVSGQVVVGVAAASALTGTALLEGVTVPRWEDQLCVLVQSRDGNYHARNAFVVATDHQSSPDRWVNLDLRQSRHSKLLSSYHAGDFALSIKPGDCAQSAPVWLIAGADADDRTPVDVLVNSINATAVFAMVDGHADIECTEFLEGRRTTFDYRCRIPRDLLQSAQTVIQIERERYGRPLPSVLMTLVTGVR